MRRQERSETSKLLLPLHAALRRATSPAARHLDPLAASASSPDPTPKRWRDLAARLVIASPEASVAEDRGQSAVVTGEGRDLPDQVQMRGRAGEAEGECAGD